MEKHEIPMPDFSYYESKSFLNDVVSFEYIGKTRRASKEGIEKKGVERGGFRYGK